MFPWLVSCACVVLVVPPIIRLLDRVGEGGSFGRKVTGYFIVFLFLFDVITRIRDDRGWGAFPMHFCDWAMIAASASLIWESQFAFDVNYFWGFSGTLQAIFTPILPTGSQLWRSAVYMSSHTMILAACVYSMLYQQRRPRPLSILVGFLFAQFYFVVASAVNYLGEQNFGYLSSKPLGNTLLNTLSDQHILYTIEFESLAIIFFLILYFPWFIYDIVRQHAQQAGAKSDAL